MPKKINIQLKKKNINVSLIGRPGVKGDKGDKGDSADDLVTSVNGKQGDVVLTAEDIGAVSKVDPYVVIGDGTDKTSEVNEALLSNAGTIIKLIGDFTISGPIRVPSDTTLDATGSTITMPRGVKTNMVQNYAAQVNVKILDGVTSSSDVFTSASSQFTSEDVGKEIRVYNPNGEYVHTTIESVNSATSITLAQGVDFDSTGVYACIGSRDKNVRIIGGSWFRDYDNFDGSTPNWNSNSIVLRHVDNGEIANLSIETKNGKYAINVGDCESFNIHNIYSPHTNSDFIHVNGPVYNGWITEVSTLGSGDDIVAFTGGDWRVYQSMGDTYGSIRYITVDGVYTGVSVDGSTEEPHTGTNGSRGILLIAGQSDTGVGFTLDNVIIRNFRGRLGNSPVQIIQDETQYNTQGGYIGRVTIENGVNISGTDDNSGHFVLVGTDVSELNVTSSINVGADSSVYVANDTVTTLNTVGIPESLISIGGTGHVTNLNIVKPNGVSSSEENTFTKTQNFKNPNDVGIKTDHIRVYPKDLNGSASLFLDSLNDQTYEFFANHGGDFGVYDQKTFRTPFIVKKGTIDEALVADANGLTTKGSIKTKNDDTYIGADTGDIPRLGLLKKSGGGPFLAAGSGESFKFKFNTDNNDINPSNSYNQVAEIFSDGQMSGTTGTTGNRFTTKDYVDSSASSKVDTSKLSVGASNDTVPLRKSNGRIETGTATDGADAVNKTQFDAKTSNIDNTSDSDKPVSTAMQTELDGKVDDVAGKGLSTNDYTDAEKTKLSTIATGATQNTTDASLRDRTTHTGAQPISSVTSLQGILDAKAGLTYVNTQDALKVNKAGDTMTGSLVMTNSSVSAGTSTDALGTAFAVMRNGVQVGRIDNNSNALRVQSQTGTLQLRASSNIGITVSSIGTATIEGNLVYTAPTVPATSTSTGVAGQIAWDGDFIYVCTATNTWKRTALASW